MKKIKKELLGVYKEIAKKFEDVLELLSGKDFADLAKYGYEFLTTNGEFLIKDIIGNVIVKIYADENNESWIEIRDPFGVIEFIETVEFEKKNKEVK